MLTTLIVVLNIVLLEIILSIDNAAVMATMVKELPKESQKRALTYGIVGAYLFRGLALLFASMLLSITWLKLVGGVYLFYIGVKSLRPSGESDHIKTSPSFWSTVLAIEIMDLIFSIDNILAAVSFTSNFYLILLGVFIGILGIRFATNQLIKIIVINPIIEKIAYVVVAALGLKLVLSYFLPSLNSETVDLLFSILTLAAFTVPLIRKK